MSEAPPTDVHCDDVIEDKSYPEVLRKFLDYARSPAHGAGREGRKPVCWATYKGQPVRLCMASRFGDVGINTTGADTGYAARVNIAELTDFRAMREMA